MISPKWNSLFLGNFSDGHIEWHGRVCSDSACRKKTQRKLREYVVLQYDYIL